MSKSKIIALILVVALIGGLVLYGFISSCTTLSGSDKGARIPIHLASFPESFDPATQQYDEDTMQFFSLIYAGLTRINSKGEVVGVLAKDWYGKYNERENVYKITFELKETFWSDGSRVSADDVVFAWKRILSPDVESPYASTLYPIMNAAEVKAGNMTSDDLELYAPNWKEIEITIDPRCFTESASEKDGEFSANLFARMIASPAFAPLKEDAVTRNKDTWYNTATDLRTNGPFKVSSIEPNVQVVLERNAYYMRDPEKEDDIPLDKKVLPHKLICCYGAYNEDNKGVAYSLSEFVKMYDEKNLFYFGGPDKETFDKLNFKTTEVLSTYSYFFNTKNELFAKAEVRNALSAVLDRNEIVKILGTEQVAANGIVPHGVYYTSKSNSYRKNVGGKISETADTSKASVLSGSRGSFTITYLINEDPSDKLIAEYAASVWSKYGFNVRTRGVEADEYLKALSTAPENAETTYDVIAVNLAMHSTDPLSYLAQFSSACSGGYISIEEGADQFAIHSTGINDKEFDDLVKEAIYCGDAEKRAEYAEKIETKLLELAPIAPLYFSTNSYIISGKLDEVGTYYGGGMNFNRAELEGYKARNASEDKLLGLDD